jgi:hypothetical protein
MYAGMDAWILTQLFDSILMTSEIGMKNDMKNVVRSVAREYHVTLPVPLDHFRVSTDVRDEIAMAQMKNKNEDIDLIEIKVNKKVKKEKRKHKHGSNEDDKIVLDNSDDNNGTKINNNDIDNVDNNNSDSKNNNSNSNSNNNSINDNNNNKNNNISEHNVVVMQKSLPLKAMVFKELNQSKKWNVPKMYKWKNERNIT